MSVMCNQTRFTAIYEAHWRAVYAYLVRRGLAPEDAADLVSATFLTAWTKVSEIPVGSFESAWLIATARNHLANFHRKSITVSRNASVSSEPMGVTCPSEVVVGFFEERRIWNAISGLPEADRELVTLVAWDGLTPAQASLVLGISRSAGRVRLHRARKRLAVLLANEPSPKSIDLRTRKPLASAEVGSSHE